MHANTQMALQDSQGVGQNIFAIFPEASPERIAFGEHAADPVA